VIFSEDLIIKETDIPDSKVEDEITLFRQALNETQDDLQTMRDTIRGKLGDEQAKIFDAHLLVLQDVSLVDATIEKIRQNRKNAAFTFKRISDGIINTFSSVKGSYLQERVLDITDVTRRVLTHLVEDTVAGVKFIEDEDVIVVSRAISPARLANINLNRVLGYVTDLGGETSHVSIIARAMKIPAVMGCGNASTYIQDGDYIIVDGYRGRVLINPQPRDIERYQSQVERQKVKESRLQGFRVLSASTRDQKYVDLAANIEFFKEIDIMLENGGSNIGLFRTEFLFLRRKQLPTEEEQFVLYKKIVEKVSPGNVIFRTLDIGGDKVAESLDTGEEFNPFLGCRGIRLCLEHPEIFLTQLKAILRASAFGDVKIMFPLISSVGEVEEIFRLLRRARHELKERGLPFRKEMEIGVMIEVPSAVLVAEELAQQVDFFSIGTNDLTQFLLAVDRGNESIANMYDTLHPAVLRSINQTIQAGHKHGLWVGLCGEMAADPLLSILLIGMGIDELSVTPTHMLKIKQAIRAVTYDETRETAQEALDKHDSRAIRELLKAKFASRLNLRAE
jgi:phosphoenolpyruvate-protein phosphotransferase (PTS system enzyme I)